jgi:hypothetical protein
MNSLPLRLWLDGAWKGQGKGIYPTIKDFSYGEHIEFKPAPGGKPFLFYEQKTWNAAFGAPGSPDCKPMHAESGFLRVLPPSEGSDGRILKVELVLAQPNGLSSIEEGTIDVENKEMILKSTALARSSSARPPHVTSFVRRFWMENDSLKYWMDMETDRTPMTRHLDATFTRI